MAFRPRPLALHSLHSVRGFRGIVRCAAAASAVAATAAIAAALSGCADPSAPPPVAGAAPASNPASTVRRDPTAAPVRSSTTRGIRVAPPIRMPNGALMLTLTPAERDAALAGAPAAVGSLDYPAEGVAPAGLLERYFRDTSRGLSARVTVHELDVDRLAGRNDVSVEGFRYRIDLSVVADGRPDVILLQERGVGEAIWVQPLDADPARWSAPRAAALPRLARLAFQAGLTDLQARVRDRREELMTLAREQRTPAPAPPAATSSSSSPAPSPN
jgi:hypothetical protein